MLVRIETPENPVVFHMDITDISTQHEMISRAADAIWGEQGWHSLQVSDQDQVVECLINMASLSSLAE